MRKLKTLLCVLACCFVSSPGWSQETRMYVAGQDIRSVFAQTNFLADTIGRLSKELAKTAADLAIEKSDRQESENTLAATRAWLAVAWPAYAAALAEAAPHK